MAFAYDEVYTEMKRATLPKKEIVEPGARKKPKYIKGLMKQAEEREKKDNIIFQHKIQNEFEAEKILFGDGFKEYITPAYKKRLEENKRYEEEQKRKEALDGRFFFT